MENNTWLKAFPMSHDVLDDVDFKGLNLSSKVLYLYLSKLSNWEADKEGWFHISQRSLAKYASLTFRTVKAAIKQLEDGGFIEVITYEYTPTGKQKTCDYKIAWRNKINKREPSRTNDVATTTV